LPVGIEWITLLVHCLIFLGTIFGSYFLQTKRSVLDVIPVDMVAGADLIAAALLQEKRAMSHLATSGITPFIWGRSIELTGLAHRKHYKTRAVAMTIAQSEIRKQSGLQAALNAFRFRCRNRSSGPINALADSSG